MHVIRDWYVITRHQARKAADQVRQSISISRTLPAAGTPRHLRPRRNCRPHVLSTRKSASQVPAHRRSRIKSDGGSGEERARSRWISLSPAAVDWRGSLPVRTATPASTPTQQNCQRSVLRRPGHQRNLSVWIGAFLAPRRSSARNPAVPPLVSGALLHSLLQGVGSPESIETPLDRGLLAGRLLWVALQFHQPCHRAIAAGACFGV